MDEKTKELVILARQIAKLSTASGLFGLQFAKADGQRSALDVAADMRRSRAEALVAFRAAIDRMSKLAEEL